jgi:hypothetical protein
LQVIEDRRVRANDRYRRHLKAIGDPREVVRDPEVRYAAEGRSLVPLGKAHLGRIGLDEWLSRSQAGV